MPVSTLGDVTKDETSTLSAIHFDNRNILAINQNYRLMLLDQHIESKDSSELLFPALKDYIGANPQRLINEILCPPPKTFHELNSQQQKVAHPLSIKTAREVAGPPGTGKTKTITELVRSILCCTDYDVLVLSERNGAIDAIASKMADDCILQVDRAISGRTVKDCALWTKILSYGLSEIGPSTKLFTLEEKMR
jgi:hypothetical protein